MIAIPGGPGDNGKDNRSPNHNYNPNLGSFSMPNHSTMSMLTTGTASHHQIHHGIGGPFSGNSNNTCNLQEVCDVNAKEMPHRDSGVDASGDGMKSSVYGDESGVGNSLDFLDEWRDLLAAPSWGGLDLDSLEIRNLLANGTTTPTDTPEPAPLKSEPMAVPYKHNKDYHFLSDNTTTKQELQQPTPSIDHPSPHMNTQHYTNTNTSANTNTNTNTSISTRKVSKTNSGAVDCPTDPIARTTQQMGRSRLVSTSSDGSLSRPTSVNSKPLRRNSKRKTSESCEDDELDEETRKEQKLEKNRQSARECRKRKKEYIKGLELMMKKYMAVNDSLQAKVRTLTEENVQLRQQVGTLKGTPASFTGVLGSEFPC